MECSCWTYFFWGLALGFGVTFLAMLGLLAIIARVTEEEDTSEEVPYTGLRSRSD